MRVVGKIFIYQGNEQKVEIEGSENILRKLETNVNGGKLEITYRRKIVCYRKLILYITLKDIEGLKVSGSGKIYCDSKLNAQDLKLKVSGSGIININELLVTNLQSEINGSGDINLETLKNAQDLKLKVSGSGLININELSVTNIQNEVDGSGKILLNSGKTVSKLEVKINGSGKVETGNLTTDEAEIYVNGSGKCSINVNNKMKARVIGSGAVIYCGNCQTDSEVKGSGTIKQID
jgi:hypothetical protein